MRTWSYEPDEVRRDIRILELDVAYAGEVGRAMASAGVEDTWDLPGEAWERLHAWYAKRARYLHGRRGAFGELMPEVARARRNGIENDDEGGGEQMATATKERKRPGRRKAPSTSGGYRGTQHAERNRKIKDALKKGTTPEALAKRHGLKVETIKWIDRYAQV